MRKKDIIISAAVLAASECGHRFSVENFRDYFDMETLTYNEAVMEYGKPYVDALQSSANKHPEIIKCFHDHYRKISRRLKAKDLIVIHRLIGLYRTNGYSKEFTWSDISIRLDMYCNSMRFFNTPGSFGSAIRYYLNIE